MATWIILPVVSSTVNGLFRSSKTAKRLSSMGECTQPLLKPQNCNGLGSSVSSSAHQMCSQTVYHAEILEPAPLRNRREVMRKRMNSCLMTPWQKFKYRRKKPWKLSFQLLVLFMVTFQVFLFASEFFSVVNFLDDSEQAFDYLFLVDSNDSNYAIYTKDQFYDQVHHSVKQYNDIRKIAIGTFGFPMSMEERPSPMLMCVYKYNISHVNAEEETYELSRQTDYICRDLNLSKESVNNITHFVETNMLPESFESIISVTLMANVSSVHLRKSPRNPACYLFNVTIQFDNSNHDGKVPVILNSQGSTVECQANSTVSSEDYQTSKTFLVFADILTILLCVLSMALCSRSLFRQLKLVKATRRFFNHELKDHLSYWDTLDLLNLWFVLIVISDGCAVIGSIIKMTIDMNIVEDQYAVCSMFLGTAVLLTWSGLLRYLGHFKKYNILLVTLKASAPSVLRFCVCGSLLYFGYLFCGWIVLGPYHVKFRNLWTVSECMFSLINGDDMFMTFAEMNQKSYAVWVFSKIYLYTFISLFIYVVLSLFIGIISDTYERIKDWGHPPCTKLQRFVHGNNCQRCQTEYRDEEQENDLASGSVTD